MSVLDAVALSGGKTLHVEAHRINDLERVGMFTPPLETSCAARHLGRTDYSVRGTTAKAT